MENELGGLLLIEERRSPIPPFPVHVNSWDDMNNLVILLNFNEDNWIWNWHCDPPITQSFKVFLHRSDEIKETFHRPFEVEVGKKVALMIKPKVIATSKNLRSYKPKKRKCYFNFERKLQFFNFYTKNNCEHECLVNFVFKECGCVKFSMPSKLINYFFFEHI